MQKIVFEDPYEFVPPCHSDLVSNFVQFIRLPKHYLRRMEGVTSYECRGTELVRESLDAGHGVILTPNHCRLADPIAMAFLAWEAKCLLYTMAGWHLFKKGRFASWFLSKLGAFSIYREGADKASVNMAVEVLREARRPLVLFPEGAVSRTNDVLRPLMDGVAFIARTAARRRDKDRPGAKVVIHPVAIKYLFGGDLKKRIGPTLAKIEKRLDWQSQSHVPLVERVVKVGTALLSLKEIEYFGEARPGMLPDRLSNLIARLLHPLEEEWLGETLDGPVVPRVKTLRNKILADMIQKKVTEEERQRRWRQLADIYLAQQISCYVPDYLAGTPTVERILETVERYEEDLTDVCTPNPPLKVILQCGPAIEVPPRRDRRNKQDPLMEEVQQSMTAMLEKLAKEGTPYKE